MNTAEVGAWLELVREHFPEIGEILGDDWTDFVRSFQPRVAASAKQENLT